MDPTPRNQPNVMTYTWENVPRELLDRARAKIAEEARATGKPPLPLKWKLIELVRAWLDPAPKRGRPPKKGLQR